MIEKLIFQIKSLIRAHDFLAKITTADSDDRARGVCEKSRLLSRGHRESVSLFSAQSKKGEKRNRIKWNKCIISAIFLKNRFYNRCAI